MNGNGFLSSVVADSRPRRGPYLPRTAAVTGGPDLSSAPDVTAGADLGRGANFGSGGDLASGPNPCPARTEGGEPRARTDGPLSADVGGGASPASGRPLAEAQTWTPPASELPSERAGGRTSSPADGLVSGLAGGVPGDPPGATREPAHPGPPAASSSARPPQPPTRPSGDDRAGGAGPAAAPAGAPTARPSDTTRTATLVPASESRVDGPSPGGVATLAVATADGAVPVPRRGPARPGGPDTPARKGSGDAPSYPHAVEGPATAAVSVDAQAHAETWATAPGAAHAATRATPPTATRTTLVEASPVDRTLPSVIPAGGGRPSEADRGRPTVSIGVVEVVVTAPVPVPEHWSLPTPASPPSDASRRYLRGL